MRRNSINIVGMQTKENCEYSKFAKDFVNEYYIELEDKITDMYKVLKFIIYKIPKNKAIGDKLLINEIYRISLEMSKKISKEEKDLFIQAISKGYLNSLIDTIYVRSTRKYFC